MKKILLAWLLCLGSLINFAQTRPPMTDYEKRWKEVQENINKGLPQSALKTVNDIYAEAKAENNDAQLTKAIIYRLQLTEYKEENAFAQNLKILDNEANTAQFPAKPLLHSMLAELYWRYYENNRWKFSQRTQTADFKNDDIETWTLQKLTEETSRHYQLSLTEAEKAKNTLVNVYEAVLIPGTLNGRKFRPTLYDFLAHRAVDFYMNEENSLTQPAYSFKLDKSDYLSDYEQFANLKLATKDTLSFHFQALEILQQILAFHKNDADKTALADADLKRLRFVKSHLILPDKEELYLKALENLEQKTLNLPVSTSVTLAIAQVFQERGQKFKPFADERTKPDLKKAWDVAEKAHIRFPDSDGSINAKALQVTLEQKDLHLTAEKINMPGKPFKILVKYKNIQEIYYRIIKTSQVEIKAERAKAEKNNRYDTDKLFMDAYAKKPFLKSGKYNLTDDKDFQPHSTEIKSDGLEVGEYLILASHHADFASEKNAIGYGITTVSDISYIHRNLTDGGTEFYVLSRTSGEPLSKVQAQVYSTGYDYTYRNWKKRLITTLISDENGRFIIPFQQNENRRENLSVNFQKGKDFFSTNDDNEYGNLYQSEHQEYMPHIQTFFFTDRAIYRPGQTLYFKGIVLKTDGKKPEIQANYKITVELYDVNSQRVQFVEVTTNEYGSFSGTFQTPAKGLTGQMSLRCIGGQTQFSVEEYKRPKFEVKLEPVKGSFQLSESIEVQGFAKAYSGANIDGAAVKYRVVRKARFPYWWFYWRGYFPLSPEMEITHGETKTDEQGKFKVNFTAIPDESVDKSADPVFTYTVFADVTDLNGETHSSQSYVSIGYKSLEISSNAKDMDMVSLREKPLSVGTGKEIKVSVKNLAGETETAVVTVKISKLKSPVKAFRERVWERPDKPIILQNEFSKLFPEDVFADENNVAKWEVEKEIKTETFDTKTKQNFFFYTQENLTQKPAGKYRLEIMAKDKNGQEVKFIDYFEVFDSSDKKPALAEIKLFKELKTEAEPGENAVLLVGSTDRIQALYELEQDGKILEKKWISLNNEQQKLTIPITENHRGNLAVHYIFIRNNRLYSETQIITVPFSNKELDIEFATFRDKLQPGQTEEWLLKLKGKKGEKVAAEMLATMYDASLDAFRANNFSFNVWQSTYARLNWTSQNGFGNRDFSFLSERWNENSSYAYVSYNALNWFGYSYNGYLEGRAGGMRLRGAMAPATMERMKESDTLSEISMDKEEAKKVSASSALAEKPSEKSLSEPQPPSPPEKETDFSDVKVRTNFNETAFFLPQLRTNEQGEIIVKFTVPESLTRWKMLGIAHTKDLKSGLALKELVTQKDLMVVPNQPRFYRENDKMQFSVKITSLAEKELSGQAQLQFFDGITQKEVNIFTPNPSLKKGGELPFVVKAGQSVNLQWAIAIPEGLYALTYRVVAKAGNFSDGEEMLLPVVTNRMLVTETMPLPIRGKQSKLFSLAKMVKNDSKTLVNHRFTLEFTSNPAWYAVQALPYLMEYPHECVEQTFSRFYANAIATNVANSHPRIKQVFDTWKNYQPNALASNLEKNQELKSALLEETPWVLNAQSESERKRNIGLLFDLSRMADEMHRSLEKVQKAQTSNGGFTWFPGMPEDRYMTQHIVTGLGHLDAMGVKAVRQDAQLWQMTQRAVTYLDSRIAEDFAELKRLAKKGTIKLEDNHLDYTTIHFLYGRSYFRDLEMAKNTKEATDYFLGQAKKYWLPQGLYMQGMLGLAMSRFGDVQTPAAIVKSLNERALHSEEMGMYFKYGSGWWWYEAPIETQALLIEFYDEVAKDKQAVEDMKAWILKQKQTQDWKTTRATSEACYALLRRGSNLLSDDEQVEIKVGGEKVSAQSRPDMASAVEAGTGYFKTAWTGSEIKPEMGNVSVTKATDGVAWGAVYWQYFEQLDKITFAETPLKIKKQLFLEQNSDKGKIIVPLTEKVALKTGDLLKVRIELRVDRDMEYVHMKDMRASALEPTNVISTYKYQDGLHYYESTKDLATHFFFGYLRKGTYVFEYPLRVSQQGDFSNGITTIQCMYAPEFTSHSEGVRIEVK
jgi:uncharacterized protein YfaS (alpha-2-macroglobulin family)